MVKSKMDGTGALREQKMKIIISRLPDQDYHIQANDIITPQRPTDTQGISQTQSNGASGPISTQSSDESTILSRSWGIIIPPGNSVRKISPCASLHLNAQIYDFILAWGIYPLILILLLGLLAFNDKSPFTTALGVLNFQCRYKSQSRARQLPVVTCSLIPTGSDPDLSVTQHSISFCIPLGSGFTAAAVFPHKIPHNHYKSESRYTMNPGAWSDPSRCMDLTNMNPLMTPNSNFFHSTMNQTAAHGGIFNMYQPYHSFPQTNFTNQQIQASNSAEVFFNSGPAAYTLNWTLPPSNSIQTIQSPPSFLNLNQRDWPPHWNKAQITHYVSNQVPQNQEQTPAVPPGGPVTLTMAPAAMVATAPAAVAPAVTPAAVPTGTPAAVPAANPVATPGRNQNGQLVPPAPNPTVQAVAPGPTQATIAAAAVNANQQRPLPAVLMVPVVQQYHYMQHQP
ncbi:hypothetical protein C8J56DRAFT_903247 [Mycena floridula]|nr:hypothetical protein C8J56DRAFT_903247 [Mycena floridula]